MVNFSMVLHLFQVEGLQESISKLRSDIKEAKVNPFFIKTLIYN